MSSRIVRVSGRHVKVFYDFLVILDGIFGVGMEQVRQVLESYLSEKTLKKRVNKDGSGFTNLYVFSGGSDGGPPEAELVLSGNTF
jgi:hypothetical protein